MSTKKKSQPREVIKEESLMLALENAVLALESTGMDDTTIFGMVNCILKGYIRNGQFVPEYVQHVTAIITEREREARSREFERTFLHGSSLGTT